MTPNKFPFKSPSDLSDFVVFDLETTGLSSKDCEIIQLSAVRYVHHNEVGNFTTYVRPSCHIPSGITKKTGITDATVSNAPAIGEVIGEFINFLLDAPYVTGYNVKFDLDFVDAAAGRPISESLIWFDTMLLAKRSFDIPRYRLIDVCEYIGYSTTFHDALCDCRACGKVLNYICEANCMDRAQHGAAHRAAGNRALSVGDSKRGGLLDGKSIVFTGALSFSRSTAKALAQQAGAVVKGSVSKKTDFLVVGQQDEVIVGCDGMSDKEKKARALIDAGFGIRIIDEAAFLAAVSQSEELPHESAELV